VSKLPTERPQRLVGEPLGPVVSPLARGHHRASSRRSLYWPSTGSAALRCERGSVHRDRVGSPHVPNVEGGTPPTVAWSPRSQLSRHLARSAHQGAGRKPLRQRLARPTHQPAGQEPLRRRLPRSAHQQAGRRVQQRRLGQRGPRLSLAGANR
jgi:hypothetical protein